MGKICEDNKKQIINRVMQFANATTSDENRFVVAEDVVDRLFIADYFYFDEMMDFVKNELTSLFALTQTEAEVLINEYQTKSKMLKEKQKNLQLKEILYSVKPFETGILKELNQEEVITILKYLIEHNVISNRALLINFINEICKYFELGKEEVEEVIQEVKEYECTGIKKEDI